MRRALALIACLSSGCTFDVEGVQPLVRDFSRGGDLGSSCQDKLKNGDETDVDCGGACAPCDVGRECRVANDCTSHLCINAACAAPSCSDGLLDGAETDVDCGGGTCAKCAGGKTCKLPSDCQSAACSAGKCTTVSCSDGVKNGAETDIDCGGGGCPKCPAGRACGGATDCTTGVCTGGTCAAASCSDGVKNGAESDVDCGGGTCPRCKGTKACAAPSDCASGLCAANACAGGLVAWWSFDENAGLSAGDGSGNGHTGTLTAAVWTMGRLGAALDFNGSNAVVTVPHAADLAITGSLTLSAWVAASAPVDWSGVIIKATDANWKDGYGIFIDGFNKQLCGYANTGSSEACSGGFKADNAYHHVALVYNQQKVQIYVDGASGGSVNLNLPVGVNTAPLVIGRSTGFPFWKGRIDEVRVFNRALSPAEIQTLYTMP